MKLKPSILGLALAGAVALCSSAPAEAQQRPVEPYYFTPKILYSHTMMDSMESKGRVTGDFWHHKNDGLGRYKGGDTNDSSFGGGASIGYDFGAYTEYPIRMELEWLYRGNVNSSYPAKLTMNKFDPSDSSPAGTNISENDYEVKSTVQTLMINAFLDFPTETPLTPYIGAGVGGAYVDSKVKMRSSGLISADPGYYRVSPSYSGEKRYTGSYDFRPAGQQNSWNFAWQVGAGCSYQFNDSMAFDLSYRYSDFGNAEFGTNTLIVSGKRSNEDFKPTATGEGEPTPGTNSDAELGTMTHKGKYDMSAHEVLFGIRITAF